MKLSRHLLALVALPMVWQVPSATTRFEELPVADGVMLIDWRGDYSADQQEKLRDWLSTVGQTVTLLNGRLPRDTIRIELTAYASAGEAVPFAMVKRRNPQGVEFYINPSQPLDAFVTDWTAYHELSHLFIPYPGNADVWFSEGLASYYQNVLQYRGGLLTEREAWQKLLNGFMRGRDDDRHRDMTLGELSPRMRTERAFMRVYWSGALYFLEADLAVREHSDGTARLDTILADYGECCLEARRRWNGRQIAREFDRLAGAEIFVPLFDRYAASMKIPDFRPALASAGVLLDRDTVRLSRPGFLDAAGPRINP
ncbi:MAG: hypothetical protein HKN81_06960 [Gammaproteobacteria bacterium]|nr:hypothetical protein [Gammaproteobacteria bacterium]NND36860.1 hypothetical protein [Gammaproteobacteria bacterium]